MRGLTGACGPWLVEARGVCSLALRTVDAACVAACCLPAADPSTHDLTPWPHPPPPSGRGGQPDVFSSFAGSYENANSQQFADFYKAYNVKQIQENLAAASKNPNDTNTRNATYADVPPNLQAQLDDLTKQLDTLRIITIVGVVFGVVGLGLGLFASCRMFVSSSLWGDKAGMVHPGSMTMGGVAVRRTKSGLSENSVSFHA